ncbi:hypothetical protein T05_12020 [Trichinella murrelli]|uniref:Uncharacterized protein n=1 Tax=Trichinella murrelli TaxID=144512 RepID=A0A0V0U8H7_9BILA|nr:hypothetical protein T05_12020 [Trichinella murrelli]
MIFRSDIIHLLLQVLKSVAYSRQPILCSRVSRIFYLVQYQLPSMKANRKLFIRGVDLASSTSGRHFSYYNDAVHWSDLVRADQRSSNVAQSTSTADRSFHNTAETLVHKE